MPKMPSRVVFDKDAPGGKVMDLPEDFVERIECNPEDPIEPFLARNSPLTAHSCWVWVGAPPKEEEERTTIDETAFQGGLSWLRSRGDAVTIDDVNRVAENSGCTSGKWKVRVFEDQLEQIWGRIARAVHSGELQACTGAKVSTRTTQAVRNRGTEHTVYVYVDNYLDENSVSNLRSSLEQLLQNDDSSNKTAARKPDSAIIETDPSLAEFKPDVFSYMGWGTGTMPPLISAYHSLELRCAACGTRQSKTGPKLRKCTACKQTYYCNVECQRRHWKLHRPECHKSSGLSSGDKEKPAK